MWTGVVTVELQLHTVLLPPVIAQYSSVVCITITFVFFSGSVMVVQTTLIDNNWIHSDMWNINNGKLVTYQSQYSAYPYTLLLASHFEI